MGGGGEPRSCYSGDNHVLKTYMRSVFALGGAGKVAVFLAQKLVLHGEL